MLNKILLYSLLLMVPGIVGSGCLGGNSGSLAPVAPVSQGSTTTTLGASASSLVLAVNDTSLSASLTGSPRTITLTNTGIAVATSVATTVSPALPAGSTMTSTCGSDLAASASCTIILTPGPTPSAAPGDTNPTPVTLTVAGTNTNTLSLPIEVLSYGSVHQAGYAFAIDDTTPSTGSIGGKVVALTDQASDNGNGIAWSVGSSGGAVFDDIPGIYQSSTVPNDACNGAVDGACTSAVIVAYYAPPQTNPAIIRSQYAAGLCSAAIGGFSDWYLPAICEMGYDRIGVGSSCGSQGAPTMQNMQSSLVDNGDMAGLSPGYYWSSTENAGLPYLFVFFQQFVSAGGGYQTYASKDTPYGVRCARVMTH
jgi:hypothetical protein